MRINPGLRMFRIDDTTVQIGTGSRSVQVSNAANGVFRFLRALSRGVVDGEEISTARSCGLDVSQAWKILSGLDSVLVSTPDSVESPDKFLDTSPAHLGPDYRQAISTLHASEVTVREGVVEQISTRTMDQFFHQRQAAAVQIIGAERSGFHLGQLLAEGGIGQVWIWDPHVLTESDRKLGVASREIGRMRSIAVVERLRKTHGTHTEFLAQAHPEKPAPTGDLSVVLGHRFRQPAVLEQLDQSNNPYLCVEFTDDELILWPWTSSDGRSCGHCWNLYLDAADENSQLSLTVRQQQTNEQSLSASTMAAGLVSTHILNWVDAAKLRASIPHTVLGTVPGMPLNQATKMNLGTGQVQTITIDRHPRCLRHHAADLMISRTA